VTKYCHLCGLWTGSEMHAGRRLQFIALPRVCRMCEIVRLFKHAKGEHSSAAQPCRARRSTSRAVFCETAVRLRAQRRRGVSFLLAILRPLGHTARPASTVFYFWFSLRLYILFPVPLPFPPHFLFRRFTRVTNFATFRFSPSSLIHAHTHTDTDTHTRVTGFSMRMFVTTTSS
jgi:hypothetical protein